MKGTYPVCWSWLLHVLFRGPIIRCTAIFYPAKEAKDILLCCLILELYFQLNGNQFDFEPGRIHVPLDDLPQCHSKVVYSLQNIQKVVMSLGVKCSFPKASVSCICSDFLAFMQTISPNVLVFGFPWSFSSKRFFPSSSTAHASASKTSSLPGYGKNGLHRVRR